MARTKKETSEERLATHLADLQIIKADLEAIHEGFRKKIHVANLVLGHTPFVERLSGDAAWLERVIAKARTSLNR